MKKALQLASVASMIDQFNISNIKILQSLGYSVDVVADFTNPGAITSERAKDLKKMLDEMSVRVFDIAIPRSLNPLAILSAYKKVKKIISAEHYTIIHCHSPIGGVICRQAAKNERIMGTKVVYTAHGFHFYDGAPLKNWIIFYPIEKHFSKYTDVLVTINNEDYKRATNRFKAKQTIKIPGVGVDTERFAVCKVDCAAKRAKLGVAADDFLLLSAGELSEKEDQKAIIDALGKMRAEGSLENIVYLIVGKSDLEEDTKGLIRHYGLQDNVKMLGLRSDIDELCETVDCYVHSSFCEGGGIALLEAMATGLPLISTNAKGIKKYTEDDVPGCFVNPTDVDEVVAAIKRIKADKNYRVNCSINSLKIAKSLDIRNTDKIMTKVYEGGYRHLLSIIKRQEEREKLGISIHDFVIISVGELNDNKNHQVIIKALSSLPENYKYIIVGKGILEESLKSLVEKLGVNERVVFTGFRADVKELLFTADCFAFPSKREGLGIAALEGMAAGLPVVGHDIGGIRDYVFDNETGWRCVTEEDYIKAIKKCAKGFPSKKCVEISQRFDIEKTKQIMKEVYSCNG